MDAIELIENINAGLCDNQLDAIIIAASERRRNKLLAVGRSLMPGDRVKYVAGRPRYLIGMTGTVEKVKSAYVLVRIDRDIGKFTTHGTINTPMSLITKI